VSQVCGQLVLPAVTVDGQIAQCLGFGDAEFHDLGEHLAVVLTGQDECPESPNRILEQVMVTARHAVTLS
jgi:hypothetical protein